MSSDHRPRGRLFQIHGPTAPKLLSPKLLCVHGLDWTEQCFTSLPTQYRLYGKQFLQVKRPNQQHKSTEGTNSTQRNQTYNKRTWHRAHVIRGRRNGSSVAFGDEIDIISQVDRVGWTMCIDGLVLMSQCVKF